MSGFEEIFTLFSKILCYPTPSLKKDVQACIDDLQEHDAAAVKLMKNFYKSIEEISTKDIQVLYTQHIDFNPSCSLYVGYHLYGDSYKRSKFLVQLRTFYQKSRYIEKGSDLPDSLPVILDYLGEHFSKSEESLLIVEDSLIPCLKKLVKAFKDAKNIYHNVLRALLGVLLKIDEKHSIGKKEKRDKLKVIQ